MRGIKNKKDLDPEEVYFYNFKEKWWEGYADWYAQQEVQLSFGGISQSETYWQDMGL